MPGKKINIKTLSIEINQWLFSNLDQSVIKKKSISSAQDVCLSEIHSPKDVFSIGDSLEIKKFLKNK